MVALVAKCMTEWTKYGVTNQIDGQVSVSSLMFVRHTTSNLSRSRFSHYFHLKLNLSLDGG